MEIDDFLDRFDAAIAAVDAVPSAVSSYRDADEKTVLELLSKTAALTRAATILGTVVAGEVARRSDPEFGSKGMARRLGYRTPEEVVTVFTGCTGTDARTAVRVGSLMEDAAGIPDPVTGEVRPPARPWLADVAAAVEAHVLSPAAAEAIARGLGEPAHDVTETGLASAAARLITQAAALDADRLWKAAHELRDELDEKGIPDREAHQREQRSAKFYKLRSGMSRMSLLFDTESAAEAADLKTQLRHPSVAVLAWSMVSTQKRQTGSSRTPEQSNSWPSMN
jgi:Domain of unknown function (DUF222)